MQNRHSMSLEIHFHILRCSSLYSQPQSERQQQPEKAPGWQKAPAPEPAPAPAGSETFVLSGLGRRKFPRKCHHPAGASQTHHVPRQGGPRSPPELASPAGISRWHLLPSAPPAPVFAVSCWAELPWGPCQHERRLRWHLPKPSRQLRGQPWRRMEISS